jgi:broad specificity phosphatase PhoE
MMQSPPRDPRPEKTRMPIGLITRRSWLILPLLLVLPACITPHVGWSGPSSAASADRPTIVMLVRHAERESETDRDPPLSEAGRVRAQALAKALGESGVSAIYTTHYRRTAETAAPLAHRLGLTPRIDTIGDATTSSRAIAEQIRLEHRGETVLVVGHSNTVPMILAELGGPAMPELESWRYGDLFVVTLGEGSAPTIDRARFGAAPLRR